MDFLTLGNSYQATKGGLSNHGIEEVNVRSAIDWNIHDNISLSGLKSLYLSVKLPNQESTKRLLEGMRLLTDLSLDSCDWTLITYLSVTIPSLEMLYIKHRVGYDTWTKSHCITKLTPLLMAAKQHL